MTLMELSGILKDMYENAPKGSSTTMIHLFGIKYAEEIKAGEFTPKDILKAAGMHDSYHAEISKGVRLARFVRVCN